MPTFEQLLQKRRSIRGFLPDPVPTETLEAIFELAQKAPSNCNTQPWKAFVVSGDSCRHLSSALYEKAAHNVAPNPDFAMVNSYHDEYRDRQVDCAFALYNNIGVVREDKVGRTEAMLRNFQFFGAPHAVFLAMPKSFGIYNTLDVGIYLQTLMLSMSNFGVSSCAQGALALYPDVVREHLGIDRNLAILNGISFGYEKSDEPANATVTSRAPLTDAVTFFS